MKSGDLRAVQQPLKDRYRTDPAAALVTLRAEGVLGEGDLDFRGTLAVDREAPVGFRAVRLGFELVTDASEEQVAKLLALTERYCVVYQTLARPPALSVAVAAAPAEREPGRG